MKTTRALAASIVLVAALGQVLLVSAAGVGVAPSTIELPDALRGGAYERDMAVMNSDTQPAAYTVGGDGQAGPWLSFYNTDDLSTPVERVTVPAESRTYLVVRCTIPSDAADGQYEASIVVRTAPAEVSGAEGEGSASVSLEARIAVTIDVTGTQVLQGEVTGITVEDTEVGYPITVRVQFENTGNVVAKPQVSVEIENAGQAVKSYAQADTEIKPDSRGDILAVTDSEGLNVGDYVANVVVTLGDQTVTSEEKPFSILALGTLTRSGTLEALELVGTPTLGGVTKIIATFTNTGEVQTPARLVGEVHVDGTLIASLEGQELIVVPAAVASLGAYVKIEQSGSYLIRYQANYGGKLTDLQEITFEVAPAALPADVAAGEGINVVSVPLVFGMSRDTVYMAGAAVLGVLVVVLGLSLLVQHRRNGRLRRARAAKPD